MSVVKSIGDGNCLFQSCEFLLNVPQGTLRKRIASEIRRNPDLQINGTSLKEWIKFFFGYPLPINEYANLVEKNGYWGSALELTLISLIYHKTIYVIGTDATLNYKRVAEYHPEYKDPIFLLYSGDHYDAIDIRELINSR